MLSLLPDFGSSSVEVYVRWLEDHIKTQHIYGVGTLMKKMPPPNERTHSKGMADDCFFQMFALVYFLLVSK